MMKVRDWRWPQIVAVSFCTGFVLSLKHGVANAVILGLASVVFWGPIMWAGIWLLYRRRKDG